MRALLLLLPAVAIGSACSAAQARETSPYALIVGRLVTQVDTGMSPACDEGDICIDVILETTLRDIDMLAGRPVGQSVRVRHVAHVPYRRNARGRLDLAMIVWKDTKGVQRGIMLGEAVNGQYCVDQSWFDPTKKGMKIPRGRRVNKDGDICFAA
jgi:hypothetical protein